MHRAWRIDEVVGMICAQASLPPGRPASRALARLARTSPIFLDSALNALWRHQGTLVHLLKVMQPDLWEITEVKDEEYDITDLDIVLLRPVISSDWDRFTFYARRVRSFCTTDQGFLKTPVVYETLSRYFPGKYIFPRLEKLDWFSINHFGSVRLFFTPTITNLHLTIESLSDIPILATVALVCPRLIELGLGLTPDAAIPLISKCVRALHHLESLVLVGLDRAAFCHIAQLPTLRYLWLMSPDSLIAFEPPPPGSPHFPALERLDFESFELAPTLLRMLHKCSLVEFNIMARSFTRPPARIEAARLYAAVAKHCAHPSLQSLTLGGNSYGTLNISTIDIYSVDGETLEPLLPFYNLVRLSLVHAGGFDLDDAMVGRMASAWPRLESLELTSDRSCHLIPRVTLEGIYAFATHCPKLGQLAIAFDATNVPELKISGKRQRVSQGSLRSLAVAHSPIRKRRPVAKFLAAVFPNLRRIRTLDPLEQGTEDAGVVASRELWRKIEAEL
ncbi:hypothetical protein C8R46DRAFT_1013486 [Mycena filopes]|nr:hypothetical protein C8R46DRAFT_1013486 [Mycena filopes]